MPLIDQGNGAFQTQFQAGFTEPHYLELTFSKRPETQEATSKIIQGRTREEMRILTENARREIAQDTDQARAILREETARIAVELAGRLIEENLDNEKNRRLVDELIKKM